MLLVAKKKHRVMDDREHAMQGVQKKRKTRSKASIDRRID